MLRWRVWDLLCRSLGGLGPPVKFKAISNGSFPSLEGKGQSLHCSLVWITTKEVLHLRGDRPLPTTNAGATCLAPGKQTATEESSLKVTSVGPCRRLNLSSI